MGKRQREWAAKQYALLKEKLGGKCAHCGSTEKVEVDHIYGRDWIARKREWSWRVSTYRREYERGMLQLLCESCNSSKGEEMELSPHPKMDEPF